MGQVARARARATPWGGPPSGEDEPHGDTAHPEARGRTPLSDCDLHAPAAPQIRDELAGRGITEGAHEAHSLLRDARLRHRTAGEVRLPDRGEEIPEGIRGERLSPEPVGAALGPGQTSRAGSSTCGPSRSGAPPPARKAAAGAKTSRPWKVALRAAGTVARARSGMRAPPRRGRA